MSTIDRRAFLRLVGLSCAGIAASACTAQAPTTPAPPAATAVQAATAVPPTPEPTKPPAPAAPTSTPAPKFKERPEFATLVQAGKLPPVEQRLPENPNVMENDEVGKYGGTFYVAAPYFGYTYEQEAFTTNNDCNTIVPEYAEGYEWNNEKTVFTLKLRKGTKWSDGEPFTSQDFVWFNQNFLNDKDVNPGGPGMSGGKAAVSAVDDFTVQFKWDTPNPGFLSELANWSGSQGELFDAMHYLQKWHIKFNKDAEALAKAEGFDSWAKCLFSHRKDGTGQGVKGAPVMGPFLPVMWTSSTHAFEANPYFFAVDKEGNQLPYFWSIVSAEGLKDEVKLAQGLAGQVQWLQNLNISDITLLKDNAAKGDYRLILLRKGVGSTCAIGFNQTCKDPVKAKVFQDDRFRQAMSAAINREEINNVVYFGTGTPQQVTPSTTASFYKKEWADAYAKYDVDQANKLLDEVGLQWDPKKEFRLGSDGKQFAITWNYRPEFPMAEAELIRDYFGKVGIKVDIKEAEWGFFYQLLGANDLDMSGWGADRIEELRIGIPWSIKWVPWSETSWGTGWKSWWTSKGESGDKPPEKYQQILKTMESWYAAVDDVEKKKLAQQVFDFFSQDCTLVGTVAFPQVPHILSNKIGNGPKDGAWFGDGVCWYKTFKLETWYFKG